MSRSIITISLENRYSHAAITVECSLSYRDPSTQCFRNPNLITHQNQITLFLHACMIIYIYGILLQRYSHLRTQCRSLLDQIGQASTSSSLTADKIVDACLYHASFQVRDGCLPSVLVPLLQPIYNMSLGTSQSYFIILLPPISLLHFPHYRHQPSAIHSLIRS